MSTLKIVSALLFVLAVNALPNLPLPPTKPSPAKPVNYWFSFGDSYTQTWFDPKGTLPSLSNPIGNPAFPGWSATGGANWVGYLTATYNKSRILTYNYAYGGAVINASLVTPWRPDVLSLTDQVQQFLDGAAKKPAETPWTSTNALFSVYIGINDIGNSWYLGGDRNAFADVLLDNYFALVQKFYNVGGRNFLFVTVPPIDRSPLMINAGPEAQAGEKVVLAGFNSRLVKRVAAFQKANRGVSTYIYDSVPQYNEILDNPTKYGFKDATSYGPGPDIFWGNDYHPSTYADQLFGQRAAEVLRHTIW